MNDKLEKAKLLTEKYGQQHLLKFYSELTVEEQNSLLDQILSMDFELVSFLYNNVVKESGEIDKFKNIEPMKSCNHKNMTKEQISEYTNIGLNLIKEGKVAALLVAGGQGTRLGHKGPKGTFSIGLPSDKSLFQLQGERLMNLSQKCDKYIPWYIMTSEDNHEDTVSFFENNNYFGYPLEDVFFFKQGQLPVVDDKGKIILKEKSCISVGANGNGGCFLALKESGALENMKKRGVQWLFMYGVDNALVKAADPTFFGFTIKSGLEASSKVVKKNSPEEKVGVLCYKDGGPSIVEYSELPEELRYAVDEKKELLYSNANIVNHIFSVDFLDRCSKVGLPYHAAHKKISFVNDEGNIINPEMPNAYKFELFMFDIFPYLDDMALLRVNREEEFAPVKNRIGSDSPETARKLLLNLHKKYLIDSGIAYEQLENKIVEISPLASYSGEDIDLDELNKLLYKSEVIILK